MDNYTRFLKNAFSQIDSLDQHQRQIVVSTGYIANTGVERKRPFLSNTRLPLRAK